MVSLTLKSAIWNRSSHDWGTLNSPPPPAIHFSKQICQSQFTFYSRDFQSPALWHPSLPSPAVLPLTDGGDWTAMWSPGSGWQQEEGGFFWPYMRSYQTSKEWEEPVDSLAVLPVPKTLGGGEILSQPTSWFQSQNHKWIFSHGRKKGPLRLPMRAGVNIWVTAVPQVTWTWKVKGFKGKNQHLELGLETNGQSLKQRPNRIKPPSSHNHPGSTILH